MICNDLSCFVILLFAVIILERREQRICYDMNYFALSCCLFNYLCLHLFFKPALFDFFVSYSLLSITSLNQFTMHLISPSFLYLFPPLSLPQGGWSSSSSNELSVLDGAALPRVVRVPCVTVSTPRFKYGFSATLMSMPDVSPITQVSTLCTCYCRRIISCTCSLSINISLYCTRTSTLTLTLTLSQTLTLTQFSSSFSPLLFSYVVDVPTCLIPLPLSEWIP